MKLTWLVLVALALFAAAPAVSAAVFDHSLFGGVLKEYVNDKGLIDYNGIARDKRFYSYMDSLKTANVETLTRDGQMAFWLNAYNAVTIEKVIRWKPVKSVRETLIPGVWISTKFYETRENVVAGRKVSQDDIEHEILRKQFREPRIHFAIICASMGCPPQPQFAYTGEMVRSQLESETRKYLNSLRGIKIDRMENTLYISRVFDWFREDFVKAAGSVMNFIRPYLDEETVMFLNRDPKIDYIHYDWSLNAQEQLR